jgi:hypothetical protein
VSLCVGGSVSLVEFARMAFAMEKNEALHPGQISFLRAKAVMPETQKLAHPDRAVLGCRRRKDWLKDELWIPFNGIVPSVKAEIAETKFRRIVVRRLSTLILKQNLWTRTLSASDSGPTPRRAKSDFLSVG